MKPSKREDIKELICELLDRAGKNGLDRVRAWGKIEDAIDKENKSPTE